MKRMLIGGFVAAALMLLWSGTASVRHLLGHVFCDDTALPLAGVQINVTTADGRTPFSTSTLSDATGNIHIDLVDVPRTYLATATLGAGESVINPVAGEFVFSTTVSDVEFVQDWVIRSPRCAEARCWLTGGRAKFSPLLGITVAECAKGHNFGLLSTFCGDSA